MLNIALLVFMFSGAALPARTLIACDGGSIVEVDRITNQFRTSHRGVQQPWQTYAKLEGTFTRYSLVRIHMPNGDVWMTPPIYKVSGEVIVPN